VNLGHVGVAALRPAHSVELVLLDLDPEVQPVLCGQGEVHPDVLAVLQRLAVMARWGNARIAQLPEQREQNLLDEFVFRCPVKIGGQLVPALLLGGRERAV